jgi:UDP-N-acetylmuramyl pentapeptide synthase
MFPEIANYMKNIFKKFIISILTLEARLVLKKYKPVVIAVSGSVGKTSTKDALYTVLSPFVDIRKSQKSFNGEIGVPLSILGLDNKWGSVSGWISNCLKGLKLIFLPMAYPKYLVLEVGADKPGEVENTAKIIRPDFCVITRLPDVPVHVEFFKDIEAVNEEDKMLAKYTKKDGVLVLNHDDKRILQIQDEKPTQKIYTYGESHDATIHLSSPHLEYRENKLVFSTGISYNNQTFYKDTIGILAKTQVTAFLPGIMIGLHLGFSLEELVEHIQQSEDTKGRLNPIAGVSDSLIIDDTYNSSPVAVENALVVLSTIPESKRKIAVLGDMLELGTYTEQEHRKVDMYLWFPYNSI